MMGQMPQLLINQWSQLFERSLVTLAPVSQWLGHLLRSRRGRSVGKSRSLPAIRLGLVTHRHPPKKFRDLVIGFNRVRCLSK